MCISEHTAFLICILNCDNVTCIYHFPSWPLSFLNCFLDFHCVTSQSIVGIIIPTVQSVQNLRLTSLQFKGWFWGLNSNIPLAIKSTPYPTQEWAKLKARARNVTKKRVNMGGQSVWIVHCLGHQKPWAYSASDLSWYDSCPCQPSWRRYGDIFAYASSYNYSGVWN